MLRLIIANKLYSSWSLRPWMVLRAFEIPFDEVVIPLKQSDTSARISEFTPAGKVPALIDSGLAIWESLAIIEYIAETFPDKAIWPKDRAARAKARAVSNEMHGGFMPLRQGLPMNIGKRFKTPELSADAKANIARIETLWRELRADSGKSGPYLFGDFTAADAMYAPVVTRFDSYQIPVARDTRGYMDAILAHPAFLQWKREALSEPWTISEYEAGHVAVETYR